LIKNNGTLEKITEFTIRLARGKKMALPAIFFILPLIVGLFAIYHNLNRKLLSTIMGIFLLSVVTINFYPSFSPNNTEQLTGIHLPIFLWLITIILFH
jgi:hypothetical protein